MRRVLKKILKVFLVVALTVVLVFGAYIAYLALSYHRLPDNIDLKIDQLNTNEKEKLNTKETYSITTYNLGFGAYTPEFSFFMDGGKQSWAESKESAKASITGGGEYIKSLSPDFALWQEVDVDGTRSYHLNEYKLLKNIYSDYASSIFCQNYDSAFIFYPFTQPHGQNKSGIVTISKYPVTGSLRRSLPISDSVTKILDLDRCYSISKIPVNNGKYLVLFNVHMSAYGSNDKVRQGQINKLVKDMNKEYVNGNYVICGGDFNHNLKLLEDNGGEYESSDYPFPRNKLPENFRFCIDDKSEDEKAKMHDTCRYADKPYDPDTSRVVTLDGFIISDNVICKEYENKDLQYQYSDHDPVYMEFKLKK